MKIKKRIADKGKVRNISLLKTTGAVLSLGAYFVLFQELGWKAVLCLFVIMFSQGLNLYGVIVRTCREEFGKLFLNGPPVEKINNQKTDTDDKK